VKGRNGNGTCKAALLGCGSDGDNLLLSSTSPCSSDPIGKVCLLICICEVLKLLCATLPCTSVACQHLYFYCLFELDPLISCNLNLPCKLFYNLFCSCYYRLLQISGSCKPVTGNSLFSSCIEFHQAAFQGF
jgi:hypothetical protein